jgi:hypothetical protein
MREFCTCNDWLYLKGNHPELFKWETEYGYGWILKWIELSKEKTHTQVHRYGISIKFCPMCGRELEKIDGDT